MRVAAFNAETLLDIFSEEPESILAMLDDEQTYRLLEAILCDVPMGTNWIYLIRMANRLEHEMAVERLRRIVSGANSELRLRELAQALVDYGNSDNDLQLLHFENAITAGIFDEVIAHLGRGAVEALAKGNLSRPIVTAYSAARIQRFIESGDPKRAFDELVTSANAISDWRPPLFEKWIVRVWQAHRDKELVVDLTDDPRDWRNNTRQRTIRYGQVRTGYITKKTKTPTINTMEVDVPFSCMLAPYIREPNTEERGLDWKGTEHCSPAGLQWQPTSICRIVPWMVNKPGNMIRDMAWYWHNKAKEEELQKFCAKHKIDYPAPT